MGAAVNRPVSGHVFRAERKRGPVWFAKYRLPDGRQIQKKLGPAWPQRGRPAAGYFTKRTAQAWLDETLSSARRGELQGMVRTGTTFAEAAAEWLRYVEQERACKPTTVTDYRNMSRVLERTFGDEPIEDITTEDVERWKAEFTRNRSVSNRTLQKYLVTLHGIFKRATRVYGLPRNPLVNVERPRLARRAGIDVFSGEEVQALVRAAAELLAVRPRWIYEAVRAGRLPHVKIGRHVRFLRSDLETWVITRRVSASPSHR